MSVQATVSLQGFDALAEQLEEEAVEAVKSQLYGMAQYVTVASPVDTGAYVTSHSFKTNTSSRGRRKTASGKPGNQDIAAKQAEGFALLSQDIEALSFEGLDKITLRNDSDHAQDVEKKYAVYSKVRNVFG